MAAESPGWGAVLLGVAIGSAMGYGAARSGAWGAREEHDAELRAAWQDGYGHGAHDENESAHDAAESEFWRGHGIGWDGGRWEERKGWLVASQNARQKAHAEAQEASARGYLRGFEAAGGASRQRSSTRLGHG